MIRYLVSICFIWFLAIVIIFVTPVYPDKSKIQKYKECVNRAMDDGHLQSLLLEYQLDNRFLIWDDYEKSRAYIDFLEDKAENACEGIKNEH